MHFLEELTDELRAEQIFDTLRTDLVQGIDKDGTEYNAAHIFIDSPTADVKEWRDLQTRIMGTSFRGAFVGMNTKPIKHWRCEVCLSALHQSHNCHIFKERGWLYPPAIERFKNAPSKNTSQSASTAETSSNATTNSSAPLESYSSIQPDTKKGWKDSHGRRGTGGKWGGGNKPHQESRRKGKGWKGKN